MFCRFPITTLPTVCDEWDIRMKSFFLCWKNSCVDFDSGIMKNIQLIPRLVLFFWKVNILIMMRMMMMKVLIYDRNNVTSWWFHGRNIETTVKSRWLKKCCKEEIRWIDEHSKSTESLKVARINQTTNHDSILNQKMSKVGSVCECVDVLCRWRWWRVGPGVWFFEIDFS